MLIVIKLYGAPIITLQLTHTTERERETERDSRERDRDRDRETETERETERERDDILEVQFTFYLLSALSCTHVRSYWSFMEGSLARSSSCYRKN